MKKFSSRRYPFRATYVKKSYIVCITSHERIKRCGKALEGINQFRKFFLEVEGFLKGNNSRNNCQLDSNIITRINIRRAGFVHLPFY